MGDSEQAVIQATKALKFLDIDGELLPPNIDIPFGRIEEYAIVAKQSMLESLLILATTSLRQENRNAAVPFIIKAKEVAEKYNLVYIGPAFLTLAR
jgi:hypothetical protein